MGTSRFERIGGMDAVRDIVDRFYDLMEHDPAYAALRAMHEPDLFPVRVSLTEFLAGWLGGPRDWFDARAGACVTSIHEGMGITRDTATQWVQAMGRAMAESRVEAALRSEIQHAFLHMAAGMLRDRGQAEDPRPSAADIL